MTTIQKTRNSIIINGRYEMFEDGVIYDTKEAKDIPQWIFEFRDFVLKNYQSMKYQVEEK